MFRVFSSIVATQLASVASMRSTLQMQAAAYSWAQEQCEKNLWMTMDTCLKQLDDNTSFVITGDINAMWTRDSTAQLWPYLLMLESHAGKEKKSPEDQRALDHLQQLLVGALRRQAKFLLTDPYANAYTDAWDSAKDARLCRGGYVFTGNFEVDSGVYFMRFLTRMAELELRQRGAPSSSEAIFLEEAASAGDPSSPGYSLIEDPTLRSAVSMLVALYRTERDHTLGKSGHRYPLSQPWELPGEDGLGNPANWTGMVWGAFRPSDDPQTYAYNIPGNLFLASVLEPLSALAEKHWRGSEKLVAGMQDLRKTILSGVKQHGIVAASKTGMKEVGADKKVYCYEVDGLGNCLLMDDANVPSLLSLPYLDPSGSVFDEQIYATTRSFILSEHNPWYFQGKEASGVGSPHTHGGNIWPLSMVMQAMTSQSQAEKDGVLMNLFRVQSKSPSRNGLSESFDKNDASLITRNWFAWPNALLAEYMMGQKMASCEPDLAELRAHLPKVSLKAKGGGPLQELGTKFYLAPVEKLRRHGVVLPGAEYL